MPIVEFPEIKRLPLAKREQILRRCLESDDMRRLNRVAEALGSILTLAIFVCFLMLALLHWGWSVFPAIVMCFAVAVMALVLTGTTRASFELWVLRRLVQREIRKMPRLD